MAAIMTVRNREFLARFRAGGTDSERRGRQARPRNDGVVSVFIAALGYCQLCLIRVVHTKIGSSYPGQNGNIEREKSDLNRDFLISENYLKAQLTCPN